MEFDDFFNKKFTYAIVGASKNEKKYGFKILKTLIDKGYKVIPINPNEDEILGIKCYKNLSEIIEKVDVVDFVTPPQITLELLLKNNITKAWFQPGSFNDECLKIADKKKIEYISDFCLMQSAKEN